MNMRKTIALVAAAVALAGCGMLPTPQGGGGGEEKQQQAATTAEQNPAPAEEQDPPPATPEQTAPAQGAKVIATRETNVSSAGNTGNAKVEVTALQRQGKTITLNWTLAVLDGKVNMHTGMGSAPLDYSVSGVSLIDPVNAKRYRVARNGTGEGSECVCSDTQGNFMEKDDKISLYAVFAAPPADVTKLNIEMPMIGVLTDVPIS